tara:strand:+ start:7145 stop:8941 length:1797 start_codon:yes stop_codon:yes gene_type:complete
MPNDQEKIVPIDYTSRDYASIKNDLLQIAERFYPDTFQDFSEGSFGSLMLDAVAYVGDQLSFYLDYNVNECFLDTAFQTSNIVRHGRILGYKSKGRSSTYGEVALYINVPASPTGMGPDSNYIPVLQRGTQFNSATGLTFVLTENVDFNEPGNPIIVSQVDEGSGAPTYYAIKAYGNIVSGKFAQETIEVGDFQKFLRLKLSNSNIAEIISVTDREGHEYYEVEYLAQDMVYREMTNSNYKNDNVPSIMRPFLVSRKYTVENIGPLTYIQFGSGKSGETNTIADPQEVAINVFGKSYITDTTFDPSRISKNDSFGVVPSNTTLRVVYRITNPANSNVAAGGVNSVASSAYLFSDRNSLTPSTVTVVQNSLEVVNERPILGSAGRVSNSEMKRRIIDTFPTQNRAVTQADYENLVYRMPSNFGTIKRCSVQKDPDSLKRNLNVYVISENAFGKLTPCNSTIKNNLKTWLNQYRMVNDTIDILDPYIINLGIEFVIRAKDGVDKFTLLNKCINSLAVAYSYPYFIGQQIMVTDVYSTLKNIQEVLDVVTVKITNKAGGNYSGVTYDINDNTSQDGTYIICPKNAIFEIKYPTSDIQGKVR